MDDLDSRAMSVRCPLCGARPHAPCISTATVRKVNDMPHMARVDEYKRFEQKGVI